ncbi:MAG: DUF1722 domain-containing protein [Spirochaetes bacterium]|jgi:uncharacterized protein YbgA (DUF1722 family)/uncharacterized protein YbbK (DUF523 family)|nr:DUF1722 domain-containing protein [Spirochaetota bacterium]
MESGDGFQTPNIVISRCIEFERCRWNAGIISSDEVKKMKPHVNFITVCPESDMGLGIPRKPVRIIRISGQNRLVQHETGLDLTGKMTGFTDSFLEGLSGVDGFILKAASPSCGNRDVKLYGENGNTLPEKVRGFFTEGVISRFHGIPVESEGRLTSMSIREHFLSCIFALARFRYASRIGSMDLLVRFHSEYKLLLMAYNQSAMREMGRCVANHDRLGPTEVFSRYGVLLLRALSRQPRARSHVNVLMHAMGYFSKSLAGNEKRYFLSALERFGKGTIPLSACTSVVNAWIARHGTGYLEQQAYFRPFPEDLASLYDSGAGRPG